MASDPAKRPADYRDVLNAPSGKIAQIAEGTLYVQPRPAWRHQRVAAALGNRLGPPFDDGDEGPGGWVLLPEAELHLGPDVFVPDWAGWRRERFAVPADAPYIEIAPDWVCEILSPSTAGFDRVKKLPAYAREGVSHAWLIDSHARTLEIFRLENKRWMLVSTHSEADVVRAEPFDAIELALARFWVDGPEPAP
jgi:Uma2 family endonuclease